MGAKRNNKRKPKGNGRRQINNAKKGTTITRGKAGGNLKNLDKGITGKKEKSQRSLKKGERIMKTKSLKVGILMVSTSPPITNFGVLIFLWSKFYKNVWKTR